MSPRYRWYCASCHQEVEVDRKVDDRNIPIQCAGCKAEMWRVPGAPGFVLKGGGWPGKGERKEER